MYSREASGLLDASKNSRHCKGVEGEVDKPTEDHIELSGYRWNSGNEDEIKCKGDGRGKICLQQYPEMM